MPCVAAAIVSVSGMPHTSHARTNAVPAAATAARHGATRRTASSTARRSGGIDAASAERSTLPPTGLYT
jgi:Flp pilus assembly protein TadG